MSHRDPSKKEIRGEKKGAPEKRAKGGPSILLSGLFVKSAKHVIFFRVTDTSAPCFLASLREWRLPSAWDAGVVPAGSVGKRRRAARQMSGGPSVLREPRSASPRPWHPKRDRSGSSSRRFVVKAPGAPGHSAMEAVFPFGLIAANQSFHRSEFDLHGRLRLAAALFALDHLNRSVGKGFCSCAAHSTICPRDSPSLSCPHSTKNPRGFHVARAAKDNKSSVGRSCRETAMYAVTEGGVNPPQTRYCDPGYGENATTNPPHRQAEKTCFHHLFSVANYNTFRQYSF